LKFFLWYQDKMWVFVHSLVKCDLWMNSSAQGFQKYIIT
jgi:hypothetical protein